MSHALLSPSSASRWLECTKSVHLEQKFPDSSGEAAKEGTEAHALAERYLRTELSGNDGGEIADTTDFIALSKYCNAEMQEHVGNYVTYVLERYYEARANTPDAQIFLEQKVDLTGWAPESFGTRDVCIVADGKLIIIDLKYGKGVPVSAIQNKQMMLYALGTLDEMSLLYDITEVEMVIYQPRLDSISEWKVYASQLYEWGHDYLKPRALMAFNNQGEFVPGSHCKFCRAKNACRALADYNMEIARREFAEPELMSPGEMAEILKRKPDVVGWLNGLEEYAFQQALAGNTLPGFKLVEGRSNRVVTNPQDALERLRKAGLSDADVMEPAELMGISKLEKVVGKSKLYALLADVIEKPTGKPTLVTEDDKRPVYQLRTTAEEDFADVVEDTTEVPQMSTEAARTVAFTPLPLPAAGFTTNTIYKLQSNHANPKKWAARMVECEVVELPGVEGYVFLLHAAHGMPPGYWQVSEARSGQVVSGAQLSKAAAIADAANNVKRNAEYMESSIAEGEARLAKLKVK